MGQIMLTFDDGTIDQYAAALEMEKNGLRGVFGIVTSKVNTLGYLTITHLEDMVAAGHCITNHSEKHLRLGNDKSRPYLQKCTPQEITQDALAAKTWMENRKFESDWYIAPFGTLNIAGIDHLKELMSYFKWIRLTRGVQTSDGLWSYFDLNSSFINAYFPVGKGNSVVGVTEAADVRRKNGVKFIAEQASINNTLVIICYHLVNHVVGEDQKVTFNRFEEDINFIAKLVNDKKLECVIPEDIC